MGSINTYYPNHSSQKNSGGSYPPKRSKKENAPDIISINLIINQVLEKAIKSNVMNTLKNSVQLIGHLGTDPQITELENDKKVCRFTLATNETYYSNKGEKNEDTQWHQLVAWGKKAAFAEQYLSKGKEVAVRGKLTSHSYEDKEQVKRYVTEVLVQEILLLGSKQEQN